MGSRLIAAWFSEPVNWKGPGDGVVGRWSGLVWDVIVEEISGGCSGW